MDVIVECEKSDIHFVCLPKNSTHLTQPLDVSFFRPLKEAWRYCLNQWKNKNSRQKAIPKSTFPSLANECLNRMNEVGNIAENLKSGFKATGIYPCNRQVIFEKLPRECEQEVVNDTVTKYLKTLRYDKTEPNRKRKKINVAPGVSVTTALLGLATSDEDEVVPFQDTDEEEEIQNEALPNYEVPSTDNINIGTFLLVTITSGNRKKTKYQYVAVVKDISNDIYHMNGLKSLDTSKLTFKVCDNDLFDVEIGEVVAVLKTPKIEKIRGNIRYVFPHEVDVFET